MALNFEWDQAKARINVNMKNTPINAKQNENDDMRPEYDFRGGVRGKHAHAYREGHTVTIHQEDGTTTKLQKSSRLLKSFIKTLASIFRLWEMK